jgi:hypothetical protein
LDRRSLVSIRKAKGIFHDDPLLGYFVPSEQTMIETNASDNTVGCVAYQLRTKKGTEDGKY